MAGFVIIPWSYYQSPLYHNLNSTQRDIVTQLYKYISHNPREEMFGLEIITLQPGQLITGLTDIKKHCHKDVGIQRIRTLLRNLEKLRFLTCETTNHGRLITILPEYLPALQCDTTNRQTNKQLTGNQQATNKQLTSIQSNKSTKSTKSREELDKSARAHAREHPLPGSMYEQEQYELYRQTFAELCPSLPSPHPNLTNYEDRDTRELIRLTVQDYSLDKWERVCRLTEQSPWHSGKEGTWRATFDWLCYPKNRTKILSGAFDGAGVETPEQQCARCEREIEMEKRL